MKKKKKKYIFFFFFLVKQVREGISLLEYI